MYLEKTQVSFLLRPVETMRMLWDIMVILSAMVWILKLISDGFISVEIGAVSLIAIVFFVSIANLGGSLGRLIRSTFRIALPIASLASLCVAYSAGSTQRALNTFYSILTLWVILFGFYLMFSGLFPAKKQPSGRK